MRNYGINKLTLTILVSILIIIVAAGGIYYATVYKPNENNETSQSSIYYADGMKEKVRTGNKVLLAELAAQDFHLYIDGDFIILEHDGQEAEFTDWNKNIALETPDMYYADFNGDGEKELLIRALEDVDKETGESIYCLYAIFIEQGEDGEYKYSVSYANRSSWYITFNNSISSEMSQPALNKKRLQLVMTSAQNTISYDSITGLVKTAERAWYVRALSDEQGNYFTFDKWEKGLGIINVNEDNTITVDVNIYASYKETEQKQIIGKIRCGLSLYGKLFSITEKSVTFNPESSLYVTDPRSAAEESWQYTFTNTASYSSANDKIINSANVHFYLNKQSRSERVSFTGSTKETLALEKVVLSENEIKLYAKSGFSFSEQDIKNHKFSVTINSAGNEYDASYSASAADENGVQVLTITLDKSYSLASFIDVTIRFGD